MINSKFFDKMSKIQVFQLEHKNQYEIIVDFEGETYVIFQSYETLIAIYSMREHKMFLNRFYWQYSKTTLRHLCIFISKYTHWYKPTKATILRLLNEHLIDFYN